MPKFYLINRLGGGFDGLVVEGVEDFGIVNVMKILDKDAMFGDRIAAVPIESNCLFLDKCVLTEVEDPSKIQFDSKSPYGKFLLEGRMDCGPIEVAYSQFEKTLQVSVMELVASRIGPSQKSTVYTENFYKNIDLIKRVIEDVLKNNENDNAEDLVFKLREFKDSEKTSD